MRLGIFFISILHLAAAGWAVFEMVHDGAASTLTWSGAWFALPPSPGFQLSLVLTPLKGVLWVLLALAGAVFSLFTVVRRHHQPRWVGVGIPLLMLAGFLCIAAGSVLVFYFGWALVSLAGFILCGFADPESRETSVGAVRFVLPAIFSEVLSLAGVIGAFTGTGDFAFSERIPEWALICLGLGVMLRSLQLPLMQSVRHLARAENAALPVFVAGHVILAPVLFLNLPPSSFSAGAQPFLAIVPALTAVLAALAALPERNSVIFCGWVASYLSASVFFSGFSGSVQAAWALGISSPIPLLLLTLTLVVLPVSGNLARAFLGIAAVALGGLPILSWGWARYIEYMGFVTMEPPTGWVLAGTKAVADFIMGIAIWGAAIDRWRTQRMDSAGKGGLAWEAAVAGGILSLGSLSLAVGGRPFGGMIGDAGRDLFPDLAWFDRFAALPAATSAEADVTARVFVLVLCLLPALFAMLLFFRDAAASERFRSGYLSILSKLGANGGSPPVIWRWFLVPMSTALGRLADYVDTRLLDRLFADLWEGPVRAVRRFVRIVEADFLDRGVVDSLGHAVGTIGKAVRLLQNGQVQFYLGAGLALLGVLILRFAVMGG